MAYVLRTTSNLRVDNAAGDDEPAADPETFGPDRIQARGISAWIERNATYKFDA